MLDYSQLMLTEKGQILMAKMIHGTGDVDFTGVRLSEHKYSESELEKLTELVEIKQSGNISRISRVDDSVIKIETTVDNSGLTSGYYMRTLGLYAQDPDDGEILYAVCISKNDDCYMPPDTGESSVGAYIQLYQMVGNSQSASLEVDPGAYATVVDVKRLEDNIDAIMNGVYEKVTYASDMEWVSATCGHSTITVPQRDTDLNGDPIRVWDKDGKAVTFEKGIGTHAISNIVIQITPGEYDYFETFVGANANLGGSVQVNPMNFRLYYRTGTSGTWTRLLSKMRETEYNVGKTTPAWYITAPIPEDALQINLELAKVGSNGGTHGNWAGAKFVKRKELTRDTLLGLVDDLRMGKADNMHSHTLVNGHTVGVDVPASALFTDTITRVKGNKEEIFRDGNVNLTPENLGAATTENPIFSGTFSQNRQDGSVIGAYSHSEGNMTVASGVASHAEGIYAASAGNYSHAEGNMTVASGESAHAEGSHTEASGGCSHAEGESTVAGGDNSHAEGIYTTASGKYSHSEGNSTLSSGQDSHAEGYFSEASGESSHAEGYNSIASASCAHAEGGSTTASGLHSHAEGFRNAASGDNSHAGGSNCTASGAMQFAHGNNLTGAVSWNSGTIVGSGGTLMDDAIVCDFIDPVRIGDVFRVEFRSVEFTFFLTCSGFSAGVTQKAGFYIPESVPESERSSVIVYEATSYSPEATAVFGSYNTQMPIPIGKSWDYPLPALVVGNGNADQNRSNAFRVDMDGSVYAQGAYNTGGADYAEYFEWEDGNPTGEDRRGLFVSLEGEKIKPASSGDYILGVVSAVPAIIGNSPEEWHGKYLEDEYGNKLTEMVEIPIMTEEAVLDEEGKPTGEYEKVDTGEKEIVSRYIINPDYNSEKVYVSRSSRREWATVGMMGVLVAQDDGTSIVNGFCAVQANGIATASDTGYRVMARVAENLIKIILK